MSMQADALITTRQPRRFAHEILRHAEKRAGRQSNTQHGTWTRIVERLDHAPAVGKDDAFILYDPIWRQSSLALAEAHRPACGVKAHTHLSGRLDFVVEPRAVRKQIETVG